MKNLPNILTIIRFILVPIFLLFMLYQENAIIAFYIFLIAAVTDFLDGFLARKLNAESESGRLLDPVADKLINIAALFSLAYLQVAHLLPILIIIFREFIITSLREFAAERNITIKSSFTAKVKTAVNFFAVAILLLSMIKNDEGLTLIGNYFLYLTAFLAVFSAIDYFRKIFQVLKKG